MNFWWRAFLLPLCALVLNYFLIRNFSSGDGATRGLIIEYVFIYLVFLFIASFIISGYIALIKKKSNTVLFYLVWLIALTGFHYALFKGFGEPFEFLVPSYGTTLLFIALEYLLYRKKAKSTQ
ncbi:MAG: hypothetical protein ACRC3B_08740 [Bacteroidia bacterium]